jgi:hypothetical protein
MPITHPERGDETMNAVHDRQIYTDWARECGIDSRRYPVVAGGLSQGTGTGAQFQISHTISGAPGMVTLDSQAHDYSCTIRGEMTPDVAEKIAASLLYHAAEARKLRGY